MTPWQYKRKRNGKRKFDGRNVRKQPKPKKAKFDYKTASYVKERDAKNKEIEARRRMLEKNEVRQRLREAESSSSEEEEEEEYDPIKFLIKITPPKYLKCLQLSPQQLSKPEKFQIVTSSDSESDSCEDEEKRKRDEKKQKKQKKQKAEKEHVDEKMDDETNKRCSNQEASNNKNIAVSLKEKDEKKQKAEKEHVDEKMDDETNKRCSNQEASNNKNIAVSLKEKDEKKQKKQKKQKAEKEHVDEKMDDETNKRCSNQKASKNKNIAVSLKEKDDEDMETAREDAGHVADPFSLHLRNDLDDKLYRAVSAEDPVRELTEVTWPELGNLKLERPVPVQEEESIKVRKLLDDKEKQYTSCGKVPSIIESVDWDKLYVKSQIQNNLNKANCDTARDDMEDGIAFTDLQRELFSVINNYQDLYYPERTFSNADEIQFVYCLHAINHVLKTRTKILHHNSKLAKANMEAIDAPDEYKDQGLARPKVLILVPFKHSCLKIVQTFISIMFGEDKGGAVINKLRFMKDFTGNELHMSKKHPKPEDYQLTFKGNINDNFKIGIAVTRKALKLYTTFYSSDIIIASPLGLRRVIGVEGEAKEARDYNFLSSIELLIMDQMDVMFMQHLLHIHDIMAHLNLQLKNVTHDVNYFRIRDWCANGWSKYYRQNLIFSSNDLLRINAIYQQYCVNYAGRIKILNAFRGSINQVNVKVPQVFYRFESPDFLKGIKARMEFFVKKVLPEYKDSHMNHTLIYVPCYYDYVAIRYYMMQEELSFVQINEYMENGKVAKARDMFFHSDAHFLLYSERWHFYRRPKIKGIRHILFYQPPTYPHFYVEMCNLMRKTYQNRRAGSDSNMTVSVIYDKYDIYELKRTIGANRAIRMTLSEENVHTITN